MYILVHVYIHIFKMVYISLKFHIVASKDAVSSMHQQLDSCKTTALASLDTQKVWKMYYLKDVDLMTYVL